MFFSHIYLPGCWHGVGRELDFIRIVLQRIQQEQGRRIEVFVTEIIMIVHGTEAGRKGYRTSREEEKWKDGEKNKTQLVICCL